MASDIEITLKEAFGFDSFRAGQRELIEAVLAGRDALGVLPTGGGKSLTYQLPASILPGLTIVVSPLIALMKDQVDAFNRRGGKLAVAVNSNQTSAEVRNALAQASSGKAAMLYVAPERFEYSGFRERILGLKPNLFVVDEAHCVNQWGFDFRPSYLALAEIAAALRPAPILALTATATPATRKEVAARLGLANPLLFVAPFDRPNLRLEVHPCTPKEKFRRLRRILREAPGAGSHIVYVGRRKDADEISAELDSDGLGAVSYHAGMAADARRKAQEAWLSGRKPVAVATVAFGMGIDKSNVRTVVHYQHPASLEAYYQEAGRAGRDGEPARCITLFSSKDVALSHFFIRNRYPSPEQVITLYSFVPTGGATLEGLRHAAGDLSDEQINVALWVLTEEGRIWRDEEGQLRRKESTAARPISMNALYARKRADYRRLEEVLAYCEDPVCSRGHLLRYFGERLPRDFRCGNCSACGGGTARTGRAAAEEEAARIYRLNRDALEAAGALTPKTFAQFLAASGARRLPAEWRKLRGFGALENTPMTELVELASSAIAGAFAGAGGQLRLKRVEPEPQPPPHSDAFWETKLRKFTREELLERKVPRKTGLSILGLMSEAGSPLSPSILAYALMGIRGAAYARTHPELLGLKHFGAEPGRPYDDMLADILAMWVKGYLAPSPLQGKRLELTALGRNSLQQ